MTRDFYIKKVMYLGRLNWPFWELECMTWSFYMAKVMHLGWFANSPRGWKGSQIHDLGHIYHEVM